MSRTSLVAQLVKNPPAMWKTWIQSLSLEDPLKEGMAIHSSIPAWRTSWTEELGGLQTIGSQTVRHDCTRKHSTVQWNKPPIKDRILGPTVDLFLSPKLPTSKVTWISCPFAIPLIVPDTSVTVRRLTSIPSICNVHNSLPTPLKCFKKNHLSKNKWSYW